MIKYTAYNTIVTIGLLIAIVLTVMSNQQLKNIRNKLNTLVADTTHFELLHQHNGDIKALFHHMVQVNLEDLKALDTTNLTNEQIIELYIGYRPLINEVWKEGGSMRESVVSWLKSLDETK